MENRWGVFEKSWLLNETDIDCILQCNKKHFIWYQSDLVLNINK